MNSRHASLQCDFREANGPLSSGWATWVVCGGKQRTITSSLSQLPVINVMPAQVVSRGTIVTSQVHTLLTVYRSNQYMPTVCLLGAIDVHAI